MKKNECPACGNMWPCPCTIQAKEEAEARRSAAACSPRWRLLTEGDKIQVGDEMLRDDCETWEAYEDYPAPGHHFLGCHYTPNLFVPIRRRIIPENKEL